jgi:hypothetical protein
MTVTQHPAFDAVREAMFALSAHCDGAQKKDFVGFDGVDSPFGNRFAALRDQDITVDMLAVARDLLPKYRRQVERYTGIDVTTIPEVEGRKDAAVRQEARVALQKSDVSVEVRNGTIVFEGKGTYANKDSIKAAGARWIGGAWQAQTMTQALADLITEKGFRASAAVQTLVTNPVAEAPAASTSPSYVEVRNVPGYGARVAFHDRARRDDFAALLAAFKALPGRRWESADRYNHAPVNSTTRVFAATWGYSNLEAIDAAIANLDAAQKEAMLLAEKNRAASRATDGEAISFPGLSDEWNFYGYQNAGIALAVDQQDIFIGDEMGVGKTSQAIGAVEYNEALNPGTSFPVVVTCPPVVRENWKREWNRIRPGRRIFLCEGTKAGVIPANTEVIIAPDSVVAGWYTAILESNPRSLIVDEAHRIKHPKSARSQAIAALSSIIPE